MIKSFFQSKTLKRIGFGSLFVLFVAFFGANDALAQSVSPNEYVPTVDRDYADQFKGQVELELQEIQVDNNLDPIEKTVRIKLLNKAVENVYQGVLIEDTFQLAYRQLKGNIEANAPNVNVKDIIIEYQNQFS